MKQSLHQSNLRIALSFILILICYCVSAQWVKKAYALKKRSEVTSVVYNGKLYAFLGFKDSLLNTESSAEVFDPVSNTWKLLDSLPSTKSKTHQGIALIDDKVWHIGGRVGLNPAPLTNEIWIYDITNNSWSQGPSIKDPATGNPLLWGGGGAVFLGRTLHVFGGFIITACNNDQKAYHLTLNVDDWLADPAQPAPWKNELAPLPVERNHFGTVVLGGKIYAIGGQFGHDCDGGQDQQLSHVYNPVTDTWTALPLLPAARSHIEGSTFTIDGKIYLVAGQGTDGKDTKKVTIFDPAGNNGTGSWTDDNNLLLPTNYEGISAKVINNTFIISHGGEGSSRHTTNTTYTRTLIRNPVYKLGFQSECLKLSNAFGSSLKGHTLLYTIDGTKNYTATSNANWLVVSKNATGIANPNAADIEVTADTTGLLPGTYSAAITATGTGSGVNYTAATLCVNLNIITPNGIPAVSITSPADSASFTAPATITINATADDEEGTVTNVDFYKGNTLLGTDSTSPYTFILNNVSAESYTLTAKAVDNSSQIATSSPVTVLVKAPNAALTVSITNPADYENFTALSNITLYATAAHANGSISKVQFYSKNTLLNTDYVSPYTFTWKNVKAGYYTLTAKATDNNSMVTTSASVIISVRTTTAPAVSISSPVNNAGFTEPAGLTVNASATDADGSVNKVDFYNGGMLLGTDSTGPYTFIWNNIASGTYTLTAKATDNSSLVTTSSPVTVLVTTSNTAPAVSITSPLNNTSFTAPANIAMKVTAADTDGTISKVAFYSGTRLLGVDTTSPYSCTWSNVAAGTYTLTAKATNNNSLVSTSAPITISVNPNTAPTVSITSPMDNTAFTEPAAITINAAATDANGSITKVDLYDGNTLLGSDSTSPYTFTWNNVAAGTYIFTAKATDNGLLTTTSSPVTISVNAPDIAATVK